MYVAMPLSRLGFEREWYFENSHAGVSTMGPKDLNRERNRSILPHLFKRFSTIPESGYPVKTFLVCIAKEH